LARYRRDNKARRKRLAFCVYVLIKTPVRGDQTDMLPQSPTDPVVSLAHRWAALGEVE
jgi:hypothetical protein